MEQRDSSKWERRGKKSLGRIIKYIATGLAFVLISGVFVLLLWNWLMPSIFNLKGITFWQAVGIVVLSRILFSGKGIHSPNYGPSGAKTWRGGWGLCPHSGQEEQKGEES